MARCDKCGEKVPRDNDVAWLEIKLDGDLMVAFSGWSRHLLPTENCEGSPSRAQYIEGQPRDTRGYTYDPACEPEFRRAYDEMKRLV